MSPYCDQPLYATTQPVIVNVTLLNPYNAVGKLDDNDIQWLPGTNGEHINVKFQHSTVLWPWSGYIAVVLTVPVTSNK